ncbi:MAG TPA: uracil-DNA glycosylase [Kineosporiaceae bacterium]|nr:uracil-DNA glycosylase [Kineosporiaceae bacterium]
MPAPSSAHARLAEQVDPTWLPALAPVAGEIEALEEFLRSERAAGRHHLPDDRHVLRAFTQPFDDVRVLVVGQDPYPTPGHAVGLAFSVARDVTPVPRSLRNVFAELVDDLGVDVPSTGDLTPWTRSGVLLLNRVLTVAAGAPGSHRGKGWERITDRAVAALAARGRPLVAILWGKDAQAVRPLLDGVPVIESVHPSPLSARRGFFGSRPFSRASRLLAEQGGAPVDWRLP